MSHSKRDSRILWMLVLLVYTKGSDGEFYDAHAANKLDDVSADNLHRFPSVNQEHNDETKANRVGSSDALGEAEINFLAKLRQRQRESQPVPAVGILARNPVKDQTAAAENYDDWQLQLLASLNNPASFAALEEINQTPSFDGDLGTVLKFLAQYTGEAAAFDPMTPDEFNDNGGKRAAALRSTMARRSHSSKEPEPFAPSISIGALTNLGDFFQHLKHNLESLESKNLSHDQVKLLEGHNMVSNLRKEFIEDYPKPTGSAAFLHAIRNYRPSHRIRALVSTVPDLYRGTNYHNPAWKYIGIGK
ncbi:uncharacterized protein LOC129724541 isoform X2 [Wyeomyia smithii]|uniref:uncharacterized protein LOC129724541 isoform X2 n=1 Tax=Wyeomyia smithii TaxID=174621 RepID=UPI0024682286|nr:uncharacterized protein LOC129724541 isoform X2 [Wyeomyia smithii]